VPIYLTRDNHIDVGLPGSCAAQLTNLTYSGAVVRGLVNADRVNDLLHHMTSRIDSPPVLLHSASAEGEIGKTPARSLKVSSMASILSSVYR
jgi:hypothetical protein